MKLSTDALFSLFSEYLAIRPLGKGIKPQDFSLPEVYNSSTVPAAGGIYVAQTADLPRTLPDNCVFICCGPKPSGALSARHCDVFHVEDPQADIVSVFETVVRVMGRLFAWERRMLSLAVSGAGARDLVEQSIPIFTNGITVSDYDLRILGICEVNPDEPDKGVQMSDRYGRIPSDILSISNPVGSATTSTREPYLVTEVDGPNSYCINLFIGQDYIATCSLKELVHPFRDYDFELFGLFAGFVRNCLRPRMKGAGGQLVTMRSVFQQLLDSYPVSANDMANALGIVEYNLGDRSIDRYRWCCIAIRNTHSNRKLPEQYYISTLEDLLPHAAAFVHNDTLVAFSLLGEQEDRRDALAGGLGLFLGDMEFCAGVSRTFLDPYHARRFFNQALMALEFGSTRNSETPLHFFDDYALDYMLQNCCGSLEAESLVALELVRLWRFCSNGPECVATLKRFLDNDCRITQTAEQLFLHRSTLIKRLEKIGRYVDLKDPDKRLYLRLCLHLPDIERVLDSDPDVSELV